MTLIGFAVVFTLAVVLTLFGWNGVSFWISRGYPEDLFWSVIVLAVAVALWGFLGWSLL